MNNDQGSGGPHSRPASDGAQPENATQSAQPGQQGWARSGDTQQFPQYGAAGPQQGGANYGQVPQQGAANYGQAQQTGGGYGQVPPQGYPWSGTQPQSFPAGQGPGGPSNVPPVSPGVEGDGSGNAPRRRSGRGLLAAGIVAAMLASGGIGGVVGASLADSNDRSSGLSAPVNASQPVSPAPDGSVESVADKVRPSVVSIEVAGQRSSGEGSGVVLSNDGLIVTNNHVVAVAANGGEIRVLFMDGTSAPAKVVGTDPATDIAVIKADASTPLTPINLGTSSTLRVGQAVAAVGSPLGLSGTVTTGIVSALNRPVRAGGAQSDQSTVIDAVQTDAAVNPGNSGGALVNMNGELVGINSAIASLGQGSGESGSIGLGFAIPVDQARRIADQLIKQGYATRAVLGVSVTDAQQSNGAQVRTIEPNGPAAKANLPEGAVILKIGDRIIDGGDALVAAIRSHAPGEKVQVTYAASGGKDTSTVDVTLGEAK